MTATFMGDLVVDTKNACAPDPVVDPIAWHACNSENLLHPVGQLLSNPYGLYDIMGNAFEWVDDVATGLDLERNEGKTPPLIDPIGYTDQDITALRTLRGGSVLHRPCRCTANAMHFEFNDNRVYYSSIRPVRTLLGE